MYEKYTMPKEKPLSWHEFHDLMNERLYELYPGRATLRVKEVAVMEGRDPRTVRKRYHFDDDGNIVIDDYIRELYRKSRNR